MGNRLEGKVALITGGGAGIGAAITKMYVEEGAKVVITGRRKNVLEEFAAGFDGNVGIYSGDISKPEDAEAMVKATLEFGGKIDILINNAAIDPPGTVTEIDIDQWRQILDINLNGSFYMCRFAIPHMIENGCGSIINVASLAGVRNIPAMPAYSASKSGLIGLSNAIALDYGPKGIRSNSLCPGATRTDMLETAMEGLAEAQGTDVAGALNLLTRFLPLPRPAEPTEIASAAVFLGSDESSYMTGTVMMLDGGACVVDPCGASTSSLGKAWGG